MAGLDWPGLMRVALMRPALGGLGLRPEEFWRLTPAELALMLAEPQAARPLDRAGLDRLLRAFPDRKDETDAG